jgi:hypothetical protein
MFLLIAVVQVLKSRKSLVNKDNKKLDIQRGKNRKWKSLEVKLQGKVEPWRLEKGQLEEQ